MKKFLCSLITAVAATACGSATSTNAPAESSVVNTESTEHVTLIVKASPKPEVMDQYLALLNEHIPAVRAEAGNIFINAHKVVGEDKIVVYEAWENQAAVGAHMAKDWAQAFHAAIQPLLMSPPEVDFVTSLVGIDPRKESASKDGQLYFVLGSLEIKPEGVAGFKDNVALFAKLTREDASNAIFEVLESSATPGKFYAYEVFRDAASFAAHGSSQRTQDFVVNFGQHLVSPPTPLPLQILTMDDVGTTPPTL